MQTLGYVSTSHIGQRLFFFKFSSQWLYSSAKTKIIENLGSDKIFRETLTVDDTYPKVANSSK